MLESEVAVGTRVGLLQEVLEELSFGEAIVFFGIVVHILGDAKESSVSFEELLEAISRLGATVHNTSTRPMGHFSSGVELGPEPGQPV
jgi:hypothetical protein